MASRDVVRHSRQTSPDAYEVSCRVRVGDHPAFTPANRPRSTTTERASPQGASLDAPHVGPPLLPSGKLRVSIAVTGLGEPHQELHPGGRSPTTVHRESSNVTFRSRRVLDTTKNLRDRRVCEYVGGNVIGQRDPSYLHSALTHDHDAAFLPAHAYLPPGHQTGLGQEVQRLGLDLGRLADPTHGHHDGSVR